MTDPSVRPVFSTWLSAQHPLEVYALAVGAVMAILAVAMWLASYRVDRRALRLFALRYALATPGWIFGHPQAHSNDDPAPFVPMVVAVVLLGLTVWALDEFLGRSTRRRVAWIGAGALATVAALGLEQKLAPDSALGIYVAMGLAMALCSVMAWQASRREPEVGHGYVAIACASYPAGLLAASPFESLWRGLDLSYLIAFPAIVVGITVLLVSLTRAERRAEQALRQREGAEQALRDLNATLEKRVATRTEALQTMVEGLESFTRSVSHDLRGSLAGVAGVLRLAVEALDRGETARARRMLQPVQAEMDHLTDLVRGLLELSRLGDAELRTEPLAAKDVARRAIDALRLVPDSATQMQRVDVVLEELPEVSADATLLQQVFANLVGNGVRFAATRPDGAVRIGSASTADGPAIFVRDNGPGFDRARAPDLFSPFRRLHGPGLSRSGIGLSIVRRIVERHGGRVWAESEPGQGAVFWFTLAAGREA